MEDTEVTTSKKKKSLTSIILLGGLGIGLLVYFFMKSKKTTLPGPGGTGVATDKSEYILGYWMWSILKNPILSKSTYDKAKQSGKTVKAQLTEDAQVKINDAVGTDFNDFCVIVDQRLALMAIGKTLQAAIDFVIYELINKTFGAAKIAVDTQEIKNDNNTTHNIL